MLVASTILNLAAHPASNFLGSSSLDQKS